MTTKNHTAATRLKQDIHLLGNLLGEVLSAQEGEELLQTVEKVRKLSKRARQGETEAWEKLQAVLSQLSIPNMLSVARAFSQFLALANIAEQHQRIRKRKRYQQENRRQRLSIASTIQELKQNGISSQKILSTLENLNIGLVLTAHPTEVNRRTILQKYNEIASLLESLDRSSLSEKDRKQIHRRLKQIITEIWHTDEVHRQKPTPDEEALGGLLIFEQTLWEAMPLLLRELEDTVESEFNTELSLRTAPIRFGSWMGGDRDGNPNVTPDVTIKVSAMSRWIASDLYWKEIDALRSELSLKICSDELRQKVNDSAEPYRIWLKNVRDKMMRTKHWAAQLMKGQWIDAEDIYLHDEDLWEDIHICYRSLCEQGCEIIANGRLKDLLRRISIFGCSLVRLDIRQESSEHTEAFSEITEHIGLGRYADWPEHKRYTFLTTELSNRRPLIPRGARFSTKTQEILDTFSVLTRLPRDSFDAYVISMSKQASDILLVELLQREMGVTNPLPVVPLFETLDDLDRAATVFSKIIESPIYQDRSSYEVMLGYSDSSKDAGRMSAAWALYRCQEQLVQIANKKGISLRLFHGRGGSVGRGGGPLALALQSQPPGSIQGGLRVTEQGEVIQAKFGQTDIAVRSCEMYISSVLSATLLPHTEPKAEWRTLMNQLAETSKNSYRGIVAEHPDFVNYFRMATPEPELGTLNIGSRPARRRQSSGVSSLRAIPWIFAWTQTRLLLPSWLGYALALEEHLQTERKDLLRTIAKDWSFFASTLDLLSMVLAKTLPDIQLHYERRLVDPDLWPLGKELRGRLMGLQENLLMILDRKRLLEHNPVLEQAIAARNPYVDPLNILQVELLSRLRKSSSTANELSLLQDALKITINGISQGMRNTG